MHRVFSYRNVLSSGVYLGVHEMCEPQVVQLSLSNINSYVEQIIWGIYHRWAVFALLVGDNATSSREGRFDIRLAFDQVQKPCF